MNKHPAKLDLVEKFELLVDEKEIILIEDGIETSYMWSEIVTYTVHRLCVYLVDNEGRSILFPYRSMKPGVFNKLCAIVIEKQDEYIINKGLGN